MHLIEESTVKDIIENLKIGQMHSLYKDESIPTYYKSTEDSSIDIMPLEYRSLLELKNTAEKIIKHDENDKEFFDKLLMISMRARVKMEVESGPVQKDTELPVFVYAF